MRIHFAITLVLLTAAAEVRSGSFRDERPSSSSTFKKYFNNLKLVSPHIAGGQEAVPHSIPHQVALFIVGNGLDCGGSLISDQWVLTAAHCADFNAKIEAVVGLHDVNRRRTQPHAIKVPVIKKIVHEGWNMNKIENDIALMKLNTSVPIDGKYVNTIRLPRISQKNSTFTEFEAIISGWGRFKNFDSAPPQFLHFVKVPILSGSYCKERFQVIGDFFNPVTRLCTSGEGHKGACYGDSGGPLTLEESDGEKTLIGVASYIYSENCESGGPTAFTRVSKYLDWIHHHTNITLRP